MNDSQCTQFLSEIRRPLLALHKAILDHERVAYEKEFGPVTPAAFLQVLINGSGFRWLTPLSTVIANVDEILDDKEADATRPDRRGRSSGRALLARHAEQCVPAALPAAAACRSGHPASSRPGHPVVAWHRIEVAGSRIHSPLKAGVSIHPEMPARWLHRDAIAGLPGIFECRQSGEAYFQGNLCAIRKSADRLHGSFATETSAR